MMTTKPHRPQASTPILRIFQTWQDSRAIYNSYDNTEDPIAQAAGGKMDACEELLMAEPVVGQLDLAVKLFVSTGGGVFECPLDVIAEAMALIAQSGQIAQPKFTEWMLPTG